MERLDATNVRLQMSLVGHRGLHANDERDLQSLFDPGGNFSDTGRVR